MAKTKKKYLKIEKGIYRNRGLLYIFTCETIKDKNGNSKYEKKWNPTGLVYTPENLEKAKKIRQELLDAIQERKRNPIEKDVKLEKYVDSYLAIRKKKIKDDTYSREMYESRFITNYFKDFLIADIHTEDVEDFYDWLLRQNVKKGNRTTPISKRYAEDIRKLFKSIMKKAKKEGVITDNPSIDIQFDQALLNKKKKTIPDEETFFDYEEAMVFLKIISDHPLRVFYEFVLYFGLRKEEALGLCWSAISFERKTFKIVRTVTRGTYIDRNGDAKTDASIREYPLNDRQIDQLRGIKNQESQNRKLFGNQYKENDFVFKNEDGSPFDPGHPYKKFKKIIKDHPELPQGITLHGLRASCVSILEHAGWSLKMIQDWVGHADAETTQKIYAKVKSKKAKKETAAKMEDLFYGGTSAKVE